ncbi:oligosaccharide flippase family protein [Halapricum desulfuricans]|uniref:MATE family membrane protein, Rfbx family n=1 Tax=Halapricum desulfuricans TaxID=2841257 RepID=A0A897N5K4_9EURY|nr:oligosaccharide flippase family protein [Halapricum desulfuricans]QSG07761.1 MATE family membrane protein, Rfbx family [Halapricum desulfuricans]
MGKVGRGVSFVFISQVFRMVAKGGLILILTRYLLTPNEYGQLFLTLAVLGFVLMFASLGLNKSGAKYAAEYRKKEPELVPDIIRSTYFYTVVATTVVCTVLAVIHRRIAAFVGDPAIGPLLLIGVAYIALKALGGVAAMFFQGFNRMDLNAATTILSNLLLIIAVPGLLILGFGLEGAMVGYVISSGVAAVVATAIIYVYFYEADSIRGTVTSAISKRVLRYSVPLTFTMGAGVLNSRIDTILLGMFRGSTAIAFYTLGKQLTEFLIAPAHSLGFGISPTFGEQKAKDELNRAASLYERSFTYIVALYAPAAAGVVLVADPTINLIFGSDYAGAVPVLQIFSLFVVVRALNSITSDALDYLGRARERAIAKGTLAMANFVLNLIFIPMFGVVGAAVATVITDSIYVGTELYIISGELPLDKGKLARSTLVIAAITAGMSTVVYPLVSFATTIPLLFGVVCIGGAVWLVLVALTDVIDLGSLRSTLT